MSPRDWGPPETQAAVRRGSDVRDAEVLVVAMVAAHAPRVGRVLTLEVVEEHVRLEAVEHRLTPVLRLDAVQAIELPRSRMILTTSPFPFTHAIREPSKAAPDGGAPLSFESSANIPQPCLRAMQVPSPGRYIRSHKLNP